MKLQILDKYGNVRAFSEGNDQLLLVYPQPYRRGDRVVLTCDRPGFFLVRFEDTLGPALVYVAEQVVFSIPFGRVDRVCYSPRAFRGKHHLLTVSAAPEELVGLRRNLTLNPYDQRGNTGMWPHAVASVETRGQALFAARNAIDGIHANRCHYPYPYQSWGINRDPNAELRVEFGVPVVLDTIVLTLRADFPHDSHWIRATVAFSDGSSVTLPLAKTREPQSFPITPRQVTDLTLKELIKAEDDSPFPALTQIEAWGRVASDI